MLAGHRRAQGNPTAGTLKHRVDVAGGASSVVRECHRRATDKKDLRPHTPGAPVPRTIPRTVAESDHDQADSYPIQSRRGEEDAPFPKGQRRLHQSHSMPGLHPETNHHGLAYRLSSKDRSGGVQPSCRARCSARPASAASTRTSPVLAGGVVEQACDRQRPSDRWARR
jgi:hypothetical protein